MNRHFGMWWERVGVPEAAAQMAEEMGLDPGRHPGACAWVLGFVQRHPPPPSRYGRVFRIVAAWERQRRQREQETTAVPADHD